MKNRAIGNPKHYLEAHTLPFFRIPSFMVRVCSLNSRYPKTGIGYKPLGNPKPYVLCI